MMLKLSTVIAAVGLLAMVPAQAGTLSVPPGVYYGNGNTTNSNWTIDNSGLELGLEALIRYTGSVAPTGNVYTVPLGDTVVPLKTGSAWGFAFSVNGGSNSFSTYTFALSVTDYIHGTTVSVNPFLIPDNAAYNGVDTTSNDCFAHFTNACVHPTAIQNAEALSFQTGVGSFLDPAYNSGVNDTFLITLSALSSTGVASSTSILVNAGAGAPLPEPTSMALLGSAIAGLGFLHRRRAKAVNKA